MSDRVAKHRHTLLSVTLLLTMGQCAWMENAMTEAGFERKLAAFSSDGCTLFPNQDLDGNDWCRCCLEHDIAYWKGGSEAERLAADEKLRDCVLERTGDADLAEFVFEGVRLGGQPVFPTWYRWGYGWNYLRPAGPLSAEEKRMAAERIRAFHRSGSPSPCD